jgi:hypothetical protein
MLPEAGSMDPGHSWAPPNVAAVVLRDLCDLCG